MDAADACSRRFENVKALPTLISELALQHPDETWMTIPRDSELQTGWRNITFSELSHAVNGMTIWIKENIGIGRIANDTAAYIGINDSRYAVVEAALIRAGHKALLPSPRNSHEGQAALFRTTECGILLHSAAVDIYVDAVRSAAPGIKTYLVPSFDELVQIGANVSHLPHEYSERVDEHVVIIHTSGSTGLPKPIYQSNGSINAMGQPMPIPQGRQSTHNALCRPGKPMLVAAPWFHMMGQAITWASIICRVPIVVLPPGRPINADLIIRAVEQTRPAQILLPPSILEDVVEAPCGLDALSKIEYVFFGGGPLATATGDKLSSVTKLSSVIGSTEAGLIAAYMPDDPLDWNYYEWAPGAGVVMEPDGIGLFEQVIKPVDRRFQGAFHTFPEISEWRTKDLYERHPVKKDLWMYRGRKDDVIVLSNGEKLNPVGFEKSLEGHPLVRGALVVGQARFQTGLLIEPEWTQLPNEVNATTFVDEVWPLIEQASTGIPTHGRVWKSKVAIAKQGKPFVRAPKGSIVRRQTVELYKAEIDALYSNEDFNEQLGKLPTDADIATTKDFVRKLFQLQEVPIPESASDDDDFFAYGTDSLQVLAIASMLNHAGSQGRQITITPRDLYSHPTINSLARFLHSDGTVGAQEHREESMANMLEKYTHGLSRQRAPASNARPEKHTYILTGSTGSLGNYALQDLMASPRVAHVYCLNRSADAEARQKRSFEERGASTDFSKVSFLHSDFSKDQFGLPDEIYERLLETVDIIIHNAWAVDFNKTLQTYEATHIAGTRRCIDFSIESKFRAHIVFISSIASVGRYPSIHPQVTSVPEQISLNHSLPLPGGYGESKHVASLILAAAAEKAGVPATIIRAGQLAGPSGEGQPWNKHEWLPSLVITSKALGMVPEQLGNQDEVDWVPMDLAAKSVVEISETRTSGEQDVLAVAHLVNPRTVRWREIVSVVRDELERETGRAIEIVSFERWVEVLKSSSATPEEVEKKPGIKLIDFYEGLMAEGGGLPRLATTETAALSETVKNMAAVDAKLMQKWVKQWRQ